MRRALLLLPLLALLGCGTPQAGHVDALSGSEIDAVVAGMQTDLAAGRFQAAIDRFATVERCTRVPPTDPRHAGRQRLEALFARAVQARDFLNQRTDQPGHGATPVPPAWPVTPW